MSGAYMFVLVLTLLCLASIDHHHKLVFFKDTKRAYIVFAACLAFFAAWDIAGIAMGIFFTGQTSYLLGLELGPEFPIEELFFLSVLVYTPLLISNYLYEERDI
jgi:lycopene cyclase domain-containing protein